MSDASNDNAQPVLTVSDLMKRWKCSRRSVLEAVRAGRQPGQFVWRGKVRNS